MLKLEKVNHYRKSGKIVFVYEVNGAKKEVEEFVKIQTENTEITKEQIIGENGKPLFWSVRPIANGSTLEKNFKGTGYFVSEDDDVITLEAMLETETNPILAEHIAKELVKIKMQQALGKRSSSSTQAEVPSAQADLN